MSGPNVKQILAAAGVSESSLDRIRFAQGVVGKSSYVAGTALLALLVVAFSIRDSAYLLAVACFILVLFFGYFVGVLWFAHEHPDMALLEGSELVKWRQIDMAAKEGSAISHDPTPKAIGGEWMSTNFYLVTIYWNKTPMTFENVSKADAIFGVAGDWLRFSGSAWVVISDKTAHEIDRALRTILTDDDHDVVVKFNPHEMAGWAPAWVDQWIIARRTDLPKA
jgi:hypothetical protein